MKVLSKLFKAGVVDGELIIKDTRGYNNHLEALEGDEVEVIIRRKKDPHSLPQRRLYWHYLRQIGDWIGQSPEELHDTFKDLFLTDKTGEVPVIKSTMDLSKEEFQEYIEKIKLRVAEVGIALRDPGDDL